MTLAVDRRWTTASRFGLGGIAGRSVRGDQLSETRGMFAATPAFERVLSLDSASRRETIACRAPGLRAITFDALGDADHRG